MKEQPDNQLSPQELLERDQKLLEALCIDYTAVYYCNLAKNTMEPIKRSVHYTTFSGGTTVERFKRYLETDLLPHLNGNSILVMDNMKSHHAKAVKELLDSSGVRYIYLPPYSPDLNPFEKLWSKVKALFMYQKHCKGLTPSSMAASMISDSMDFIATIKIKIENPSVFHNTITRNT